MRCEQVEGLAGAYAVFALPDEEREDVERHVAGCSQHPALAELRAVARSLALAAPEMQPPVALKARIMDAINADIARPAASRPVSRARRLAWLRRLFASPAAGYGLAAALAIAVAVLLVADLGGGGDNVVRQLTGNGSGQVVYIPDRDTAVLTAEGLQPPSPGKTYQVWSVADATPVSIGFLEVSEQGQASSVLHVHLRGGEIIAVTLEPSGGSPAPTTDPVLRAQI